jgi:hypothetical protein
MDRLRVLFYIQWGIQLRPFGFKDVAYLSKHAAWVLPTPVHAAAGRGQERTLWECVPHASHHQKSFFVSQSVSKRFGWRRLRGLSVSHGSLFAEGSVYREWVHRKPVGQQGFCLFMNGCTESCRFGLSQERHSILTVRGSGQLSNMVGYNYHVW